MIVCCSVMMFSCSCFVVSFVLSGGGVLLEIEKVASDLGNCFRPVRVDPFPLFPAHGKDAHKNRLDAGFALAAGTGTCVVYKFL